jgi:hypothetical protein
MQKMGVGSDLLHFLHFLHPSLGLDPLFYRPHNQRTNNNTITTIAMTAAQPTIADRCGVIAMTITKVVANASATRVVIERASGTIAAYRKTKLTDSISARQRFGVVIK